MSKRFLTTREVMDKLGTTNGLTPSDKFATRLACESIGADYQRLGNYEMTQYPVDDNIVRPQLNFQLYGESLDVIKEYGLPAPLYLSDGFRLSITTIPSSKGYILGPVFSLKNPADTSGAEMPFNFLSFGNAGALIMLNNIVSPSTGTINIPVVEKPPVNTIFVVDILYTPSGTFSVNYNNKNIYNDKVTFNTGRYVTVGQSGRDMNGGILETLSLTSFQ